MTGSSANKRGAGEKVLTRHITDLETWLEACSVYACMLDATKPTLAPEPFRYQKFIAKTSCTYEVYAWLQYDAQFRHKIASDPSMSWSIPDSELTATWLSADAIKQKQACFTCGSPQHMATNRPLRAPTKSAGIRCSICNTVGHAAHDCVTMTLPAPSKAPAINAANTTSHTTDSTHVDTDADRICKIYNRKGNCFRGARCPYFHICKKCRGPHSAAISTPLPIHAHTIQTPLQPQVFAQLLASHPDKAFTS